MNTVPHTCNTHANRKARLLHKQYNAQLLNLIRCCCERQAGGSAALSPQRLEAQPVHLQLERVWVIPVHRQGAGEAQRGAGAELQHNSNNTHSECNQRANTQPANTRRDQVATRPNPSRRPYFFNPPQCMQASAHCVKTRGGCHCCTHLCAVAKGEAPLIELDACGCEVDAGAHIVVQPGSRTGRTKITPQQQRQGWCSKRQAAMHVQTPSMPGLYTLHAL